MKHNSILIIGLLYTISGTAQSLHFTAPTPLLPDANTDKAVSITHFNEGYFVAWKSPGNNADVHYSYLGKNYDTTNEHHQTTIPNATTNFAPVLRVSNNRIYLFWINSTGTLNYVVNRTDTAFDTSTIHTMSFPSGRKL